MKTYFYRNAILAILAIISFCAEAQQNALIDSLNHLLQTAKEDTQRVFFLHQLSTIHDQYGNISEAQQYVEKALTLSKQSGYQKGLIESLNIKGVLQTKKGNYEQALVFLKESLEISKASGRKQQVAMNLMNIGIIHEFRGAYKPAEELFLEALDIWKELKNKHAIAGALNSIGVIHDKQGYYEQALKYYLEALKIKEEINHLPGVAASLSNIGLIFSQMERNDEALKYFEKALAVCRKSGYKRGLANALGNIGTIYNRMGNYDKAREHHLQALKMRKESGDQRGITASLGKIGDLYMIQKDYDKALKSYSELIPMMEQLGDRNGLVICMTKIERIYLARKAYEKSILHAQKALETAKEINMRTTVKDLYLDLSMALTETGKHKEAYENLSNYIKMKDSIYNEKSNEQMADMQVKYETAEKEKEIARLNEEQARKDARIAKQKQRQNTLIFGLLGFFTVVFAFYSRYKNRKQLQLEKQGMEYEQKALHLQMNPHFIFNSLGSINSFVTQNEIKPAVAFLSKFARLMRLTLEHSQESAIPIEKEVDSLRYYMELEQLRFNNCFDFDITIDENVPSDLPIPSLLIQPFVENAILHGLAPKKKGGKLEVRFFIETDQLICSIKDNGIGREEAMERKKAGGSKHRSLAMHIVEERLNILNKTAKKNLGFSINDLKDSDSNSKGTEVRIRLGIHVDVVAT